MDKIPYVTVIVPIRNESKYIIEGLKSIVQQNYPVDRIEIIISDGMSTDNTRQLIFDFIALHPQLNAIILDNPSKIVPTGMNVALLHAKSEIFIRMDGHTTISPDYIYQCVDSLQKNDADNVGGKMYAIGENYFGEVVAVATSSRFGVGGARFHYSDQEEWVDTVYMGAWRREVFERIGLFDEELIRDQDDEFNYRLRANGGNILISPKIKSTYTVRGTPIKLWKQYFQYGFWKVRVLQKHPRQMSIRQFIPPIFVLALLMSLILALLPATRPLSFLVPLLYVLVNLSASLVTGSKHSWKHMPLLPVTFAILHLSYGSGFLIGLLRFIHRWGDTIGRVPRFVDSYSQKETI